MDSTTPWMVSLNTSSGSSSKSDTMLGFFSVILLTLSSPWSDYDGPHQGVTWWRRHLFRQGCQLIVWVIGYFYQQFDTFSSLYLFSVTWLDIIPSFSHTLALYSAFSMETLVLRSQVSLQWIDGNDLVFLFFICLLSGYINLTTSSIIPNKLQKLHIFPWNTTI